MSIATERENNTNRISLIKAAADAFADAGYDGASLRSIAEAAGVSYQLITHYFGSKEDLWRSTVHYLFERLHETGNALGFDVSGNVHLQFRNHIRLLLTDLLQRPQIRKIWTQEQFAASDRYTEVIEPHIATLCNELALPYYREVVRLGIVQRYTAQEIAIIVAAVIGQNVVYPDPVEFALGAETGAASSVNRQVDLIFDLLTAGEKVSETHEITEEATSPVPSDELRGDGIDQSGNDGTPLLPMGRAEESTLSSLRSENVDLKRALAEFTLHKAALHTQLRRGSA